MDSNTCIPASEALLLQHEGKILKDSGYHYKDQDTGSDMVEYHADACEIFQQEMSTTGFGGKLSVRFTMQQTQKPLLIFGHDECIFKQFTFSLKGWTGPNGETIPMPKDNGLGLMISAFQSQEFGFGLELLDEQLRQINET